MDAEDFVLVSVWLFETARLESEVWSSVEDGWSMVWALNWCIGSLFLDVVGGWDLDESGGDVDAGV